MLVTMPASRSFETQETERQFVNVSVLLALNCLGRPIERWRWARIVLR